MSFTKITGISLLVVWVALLFSSCEEVCETNAKESVGDEFFTVEYRNSSGQNYLNSIYNLSNVVVFLDTAGGATPFPEFELIRPGHEEGAFGPFEFTDRFVSPVTDRVNTIQLYGQPFKFDYFFKKDTYGMDTLSVEFLLEVDECTTFWQYIRYSLNGEPLPEYDGMQQANIVIVE